MLARICDEIHVKRADALLQHAPHRLPKVGDHAHQRQSSEALRAGRAAVVGRKEIVVLIGGQLVVDAEVAEIEERIAHPGVLPVDDPDARAVVDEVRVEQIVVAGTRLQRRGEAGHLDPATDRRGRLVRRRDRDPAGRGQRPVGLHDPERHEQARDRRTVVDPPQR